MTQIFQAVLSPRNLPVWMVFLCIFFWGGDKPEASLFISAILLLVAAGAILLSPQLPRIGEFLAAGVFGVFFAIAIARGWMATGAHEYAVLAAVGGVTASVWRGARTGRDAEQLWRVCVILAGLIALLAFWDFIADPRTAFGTPRPYHLNRLSWPFLSANTAASFYTLVGLMAVAELVRQGRRTGGVSLSERLESGIKRLAPAAIVVAFALSALILTASRAGITLGLASLAALVLWNRLAERKAAGRSGPGAMVLLVVVLGGLAVFLSGEVFWSRMQMLDGDSRSTLFAAYWDAVRYEPWLGNGLGGFALANDFAASAANANILQSQGAAHNVLLQWLLQAGMLGTAVWLVGLAAIFRVLMQGLSRRRSQTVYIRAVLVGLCFIGAHGMVDYAVEIPMVAWFLSGLVGIGVGISLRGTRSGLDAIQTPVFRLGLRLVLAAVPIALAAWSASVLLSRLEIRNLEEADPSGIVAVVEGGLPEGRSAYWYDTLGSRLYDLPDPRLDVAILALEQAAALEPRDGHIWLRLAYARSLVDGAGSPSALEALEMSYYRLPYGESDMRRWRLQFCDSHWAHLSDGIRAAAMREARSERAAWLRDNLEGPLALIGQQNAG